PAPPPARSNRWLDGMICISTMMADYCHGQSNDRPTIAARVKSPNPRFRNQNDCTNPRRRTVPRTKTSPPDHVECRPNGREMCRESEEGRQLVEGRPSLLS